MGNRTTQAHGSHKNQRNAIKSSKTKKSQEVGSGSIPDPEKNNLDNQAEARQGQMKDLMFQAKT